MVSRSINHIRLCFRSCVPTLRKFTRCRNVKKRQLNQRNHFGLFQPRLYFYLSGPPLARRKVLSCASNCLTHKTKSMLMNRVSAPFLRLKLHYLRFGIQMYTIAFDNDDKKIVLYFLSFYPVSNILHSKFNFDCITNARIS